MNASSSSVSPAANHNRTHCPRPRGSPVPPGLPGLAIPEPPTGTAAPGDAGRRALPSPRPAKLSRHRKQGRGPAGPSRVRTRHQAVNWRRSSVYACFLSPRYPARNRVSASKPGPPSSFPARRPRAAAAARRRLR